jgi:5-methyltetrahydrofolate--homocysteine methyltransferase
MFGSASVTMAVSTTSCLIAFLLSPVVGSIKCGFNVIDLGIDVAPEKFVEAIKEHNPQVVGMSALLTTTMAAMKQTLDAMEEAGVRDQAKVIIGGAPVSQGFADEIGADGYASDAIGAKDLCTKLIKG